MEQARKFLSQLELGESTVFRNLTMFTVKGATDGSLEYLTLADAMRMEVVKVSEISAGGSVPELLFENLADLPVLMRIPLERAIGESLARGRSLVEAYPAYLSRFRELYERMRELIDRRTAIASHSVAKAGSSGATPEN